MRRTFLALSLLLVCHAATAADDPTISPQAWSLPLNQIAQVACHNCYEHQYNPSGAAFTDALSYVKTVELDFWDQRDAVTGGSKQHWFVRHNAGTLFQSGNDNNCSGDGGGSNDLAACLTDIKRWSDAHPDHFPLIVILDKKQGWSKVSSGRTPADLDGLVTRLLGASLYTPAQLYAWHAQNGVAGTLRDKVKAAGWPTADALRGRVMLMMNNPTSGLDQYLSERGLDGAIFVQPEIAAASEVAVGPSGMSAGNVQYVVNYNMNAPARAISADVQAARFLGRVYGDDDESFLTQVGHGTHLSAYHDYIDNGDGAFRIRPLVLP